MTAAERSDPSPVTRHPSPPLRSEARYVNRIGIFIFGAAWGLGVVSASAGGLKGTTDLGPEYLTAYEINFNHAFGKRVHLSASVYYNYIKDIVEIIEDSTLTLPFTATWANVGKRKATGVDLGIKVFFNDNIRGFLKYSYVDGEVERGGVGDTPASTLHKLPGTVPHSFKTGISCKLFKGKFNLYVSNHYIHEWETFSDDTVWYIPEAIHRLNWNFQVSYKF